MHGTATYPRNDFSHPMNRGTRFAFALNLVVPLVAVMLGNALVAATGWESDPAFETLALAPPGWLIGAVWLVIYPMWGAARWHAWQAGRRGQRESWTVVALMAWGLLYPFGAAITGTLGTAVLNVVSLALAVFAAWRLRPISRTAFALVAWVTFATALGFAAVAN